jgi:hypothetical protein
MAEEHVGADGKRPWAWTKIFTGFKVALDLKKLLLAAAGIVATWLGWLVLSWLAYFPFTTMPNWERDYADRAKGDKAQEAWTAFKARLASWNLLHELAGSKPVPVTAADLAVTLQEYDDLHEIEESLAKYDEPIRIIAGKDKELKLEAGGKQFPFTIVEDPGNVILPPAAAEPGREQPHFVLHHLVYEAPGQFRLSTATIKVTTSANELQEIRTKAANLAELQKRAAKLDETRRKSFEAALATYQAKLMPRGPDGVPPEKPGGRLRVSPWSEYRGENPFLFVAKPFKEPVPLSEVLNGILAQIPVLLEPLVKIATPIVYLFDRRADWYVQIYLLLVLLYALAVWGFFGGAITRLAAVQVARNEKIPLREAVLFAKDRFLSYFAAPAFPILLLGILVFCLWIFGWVAGLIPIFGDIIVAGLLWPIILIVGLIMAVVLVGLVGWPLMNPTISVEGSDSFDALSRSYSYVYQAPWHYLWYGFVATVYGMAVVFFVGFMASLLVFLGKWGVGMTPGIRSAKAESDREPSYLFMGAPTSFGWRDLLIHNSQFTVAKRDVSPNGVPIVHYEFKREYQDSMHWYNYTGTVLVSIWVGAFFLLVVGFGYSYFWSAATIIYFLMRRQVDDTDLDEVHLEEDEALDPFARPPATAAAPAPGQPRSDKVSLAMVEPPALRTGITTATPPPPTAPFAPPPPAAAPPVAPPALSTPAPPVEGRPTDSGAPPLPDKKDGEPPV